MRGARRGRNGEGGGGGGILLVFACFVGLCFGQSQFIDVGNGFPTFYDTYGSMYNDQPGSFILRCEAGQSQSCVQDIALECDDVKCAECVSNSVGDSCSSPPDGENYILLPDTAVYYDNLGTHIGVDYETFQIIRFTENGTSPLVQLFLSIVEAPILPVPTSQTVGAQTGETITIELEGVDMEGSGYEVFVSSAPIQGSLTLTDGNAITYGDAIDSREVLYTAGSVVVDDSFTFGVRSDPSVVGGGSTGEIGVVDITIETNTVEGAVDQTVEIVESTEEDFDLDLDNPNGVSYEVEFTSTPEGDLRTRAASGVNLGSGDTITTGELVYTAPAITDQFGSDYVDYVVRVSGTQVSYGSVIFEISTAGAPITDIFLEIEINAAESTCIDLKNYTAGHLSGSDATYYITALTQEGTVEDSCVLGSTMDEPGELDDSTFQILTSSLTGSYTTAVEWSVTETATGLSSTNNMIYFRVTDLAQTAPVAVSTSISVRQASQGLLYLTGYSPVNNPLQPEIVSCPSRTTLGALYQSTDGAIISCDRNTVPIPVSSDDATVLYKADTGRPSYDYLLVFSFFLFRPSLFLFSFLCRFRFQMRDTVTGETSESIPVEVFVEENQTPIAVGGSFTGNEDIDLVIDRYPFFFFLLFSFFPSNFVFQEWRYWMGNRPRWR